MGRPKSADRARVPRCGCGAPVAASARKEAGRRRTLLKPFHFGSGRHPAGPLPRTVVCARVPLEGRVAGCVRGGARLIGVPCHAFARRHGLRTP